MVLVVAFGKRLVISFFFARAPPKPLTLLLQAELKTTETEMGKAMSEWNQRRTCLEASVKDYRQEIEETRRGKSHDEIVASDREQVCPLTYFSVCFFMIKINEKQWPPTP